MPNIEGSPEQGESEPKTLDDWSEDDFQRFARNLQKLVIQSKIRKLEAELHSDKPPDRGILLEFKPPPKLPEGQ